RLGWYAVHLDERPPNLSVALLEPVAHSCDRFHSPVPGPGEEHIVPLHPFEARVDVDARRAEAVAYVDRAIHVRIGEGDEDLLLALQRVRLEEVPLVPCLQPFLLVLCHGAQPLTRDATVPSTDLTASSMRSSEGPPPCAKAADPPPEPPSLPATCLAISPAERPLSLALAPTKQTTLAEFPMTKTLT